MSDPVYLLGIHDGHNCGATMTCDGTVAASVSKERLRSRWAIWSRYLETWHAEVTLVAALDQVVAASDVAQKAGQAFDIIVVEGDHDIDGVVALRQQAIDAG